MYIDYAKMGKRIKQIRTLRGMSQKELAERIDRSPTFVSYIETGAKSMSLDTFILVANALQTSADDILFDSMDNNPSANSRKLSSIISDCSEYEYKILISLLESAKLSLRANRRAMTGTPNHHT